MPQSTTEPLPTPAARHMLLIEDEPILAMSTQMMLSAIGYDDVEIVGSVREAMLQIETTAFDLAVLDLNLGCESGVPIAERLCSLHIPVIITTGFDSVDLPAICAGTIILRKPFRMNDLASAIARVIHMPQPPPPTPQKPRPFAH